MGNSLEYPRDCIIENFTDVWIQDLHTVGRTAHPVDWKSVDESEFGISNRCYYTETVRAGISKPRSITDIVERSHLRCYEEDCYPIDAIIIHIKKSKNKKRKEKNMD